VRVHCFSPIDDSAEIIGLFRVGHVPRANDLRLYRAVASHYVWN
jgi:hypothetical protein